MRRARIRLRGLEYVFASAAAAVATVLACSSVVSAQGADLLRCRRVDSARVARVAEEVETTFGLDGRCRIRGRARELCAPAYEGEAPAQTSTTTPAQSAPTTARLCFRLRCRARSLPTLAIADRFGQREIALARPAKICLPVTLDDGVN